MQTPTIHLNGTNGVALTDAYSDAASAIRDAIDAAHKTGPNGRDYYPQGPDALTAALAEHSDRIAKLEAIKAEFEALALHCYDHTPTHRRA